MSDVQRTVLYFCHGRSLGGAPLSLLYLIQHLDKARFRPVVVCLHDGDIVRHFRQLGVEAVVCRGLSDFQHTTAGWYDLKSPLGAFDVLRSLLCFFPTVLRTRALLRTYPADLVHLNSITLAPEALGSKLAGQAVVWHIREAVVRGHFGLRRRVLRSMVESWADEAVFICEDNRQRLGVPDLGTVVYNFVDLGRFDRYLPSEPVRTEFGISDETNVVLLLGGISRIKGTLELVRAAAKVRQSVAAVLFLIAGSGRPEDSSAPRLSRLASTFGYMRYTEQVRRAVEELGLKDVVRFLPFRTDVERLIAASDVVVFPSTQPHFARPVIEAGAMAKPVVASHIGGVDEVVRDGSTGLLVPPRDVDALAMALVQVLTDRELARRLGEGGYVQARDWFGADLNVERTIAVYRRVLG